MLRISKLADYGTVVMVYLARHHDALHNATQIAESIHLATPTVRKLLKLLASHGLLQSQLGTKGGYALAKRAQDISVADIIQAVDGATALTECSHHPGECALEAVCSISGNWQLISRAINTALDSVSLAELAKPDMQISRVNVTDIKNMSKQRHE